MKLRKFEFITQYVCRICCSSCERFDRLHRRIACQEVLLCSQTVLALWGSNIILEKLNMPVPDSLA